jgi:hypothetical protein
MQRFCLLFFAAIVTSGLVACNQNPVIETNDTPTPVPSEDPAVQTRDIAPGTRLGGITGACFAAFYDASVTSAGFVGVFDTARASWNLISSKVAVDKSKLYVDANDIYSVSAANRRPIQAETTFFTRNSNGTFTAGYDASGNFHHCQIIIHNGTFIQTYPDPNIRSAWIRSVAIHEVGHTLQLDHNTQAPSASTMRPDSDASGVTTYDRSDLVRK